jgi:hypothetical protein
VRIRRIPAFVSFGKRPFLRESESGEFFNFFGMPPSSVEEREGVIRMNHAKALAVALDC